MAGNRTHLKWEQAQEIADGVAKAREGGRSRKTLVQAYARSRAQLRRSPRNVRTAA